MKKYIKIKRDTEIGLKLTNLLSVLPKAKEQAKLLCEKYNFKGYSEGYWTYGGGISAFANPVSEVSMSLFKKTKDNYYEPKLNINKGREVQKEMNFVLRVERNEVNELFGLDVFAGLGITFRDKEWIGLYITDQAVIPKYAVEITVSEYEKLGK